MSTTSTFAIGLGSGLALWHFSKPASSAPITPRQVLTAPGPRSCFVRVTGTGFIVDGASVDLAETVRRCRAIGHATITVEKTAPASAYAALIAGLDSARVPMVRNSGGPSEQDAKIAFTLITYPQGRSAGPTTRYFRAESPITWNDARDRLAAAGHLDLALAGRTHQPGGWMLSIATRDFRAHRAEPMPGPRNAKKFSIAGRTISRDGNPILHLERVDLGDARYAISPHHADLLAQRIVRLLNQHGAR